MTRNEIIAHIDHAINEARAHGFLGDDANEYANMELTGGFWVDELRALGADDDKPGALAALAELMIERFEEVA